MTTQRNHNPRRHLAICNHQSTMSLPPSIEIDTMRQSPTNHNENSCPRVTRARATTPTHVIPAPTKVIPAPTNIIPAKAGILSLGMDCAQARSGIDVSLGSCRPLAVSNGTFIATTLTLWGSYAKIYSCSGRSWEGVDTTGFHANPRAFEASSAIGILRVDEERDRT